MQVLCRSHKIIFRGKIGGIDYQSLAFPVADRVPIPCADARRKMRASVKRNDPGIVNGLHNQHYVIRTLHDLVIAAVWTWTRHRHAPGDASLEIGEVRSARGM